MEEGYDFVDKKERLADLIEEYIQNKEMKNDLISFVNELSKDEDFKEKELFKNIFKELNQYLLELSTKELKQRVLMIRGFIE